MKRESANPKDRIIYMEYVVTVSMPQILDRQKRKAARSQLRAAIAAILDRLEAAGAELLPPGCGMEIDGFEDGPHVITRGGRKIFPPPRGGWGGGPRTRKILVFKP